MILIIRRLVICSIFVLASSNVLGAITENVALEFYRAIQTGNLDTASSLVDSKSKELIRDYYVKNYQGSDTGRKGLLRFQFDKDFENLDFTKLPESEYVVALLRTLRNPYSSYGAQPKIIRVESVGKGNNDQGFGVVRIYFSLKDRTWTELRLVELKNDSGFSKVSLENIISQLRTIEYASLLLKDRISREEECVNRLNSMEAEAFVDLNDLKNSSYTGKAKLYILNSCFIGRFKKGVPSGKGLIVYPNKMLYSGNIRDAVPHGNGVVTFPDGWEFKGQWKNGKPKKGICGYSEQGKEYLQKCFVKNNSLGKTEWSTSQMKLYITFERIADAFKNHYKSELSRTLSYGSLRDALELSPIN